MPILSGTIVADLGPLVDLFVGTTDQRHRAFQKKGQLAPVRVRVRALIDTGASCTCVDPTIIAQLGLTPTGTMLLHTTSTGNSPIQFPQYDVSISIDTPQIHVVRFTLPVVASDLCSQGIDALIGRDILDETTFFYNGPQGNFSWSL